MNDALTGKVTFPKMLLDREILNGEPANRKSALLDLFALANDRERTVTLGAGDLRLKRGQLAYSQITLAKMWRWDRDKVHRVLNEFQNEGLITFDTTARTTIITLIDYTIYNPDTATLTATDTASEPATDTATNLAQKGEVGRGSKKREGEEEPGFAPDDKEVFDFAAAFAGEPATGTPGPIPLPFVERWLARMLGRREFPPRWQRALVADWRASHREYGKKAAGLAGACASPVSVRISLEREAKKLREKITHSPVREGAGVDLSCYSPQKLAAMRDELRNHNAQLAAIEKQLSESA